MTIAAAACVAVATYLAAAPPDGAGRSGAGSANGVSGPGFDAQNNPGVLLGSQASQASGNPGFNSENNPGTLGSEFGRSTAGSAGTNGADASANGGSTAAQAGTNGAEHRRGHSFFGGTSREIMVETTSAAVAGAAKEKANRSEASKLFESSQLYAGITPVPSATPGGQKDYGPTNNPGLDHMSEQGLEHSEAGRSTAESARTNHATSAPARVSPIPSASPAQRPPENPGVSPVPSAPESRGINPIPRDH